MSGLQWGVSPVIRTADAYNGESAIFIEATQLYVDRAFATRTVREWCDFFAAGPSLIEELGFVSRTPARLWNSLAGQTQLRVLHMKWGDYSDLSVLAQMRGLAELGLGSSPDEHVPPRRRQRATKPRLEMPLSAKVRRFSC